MKLRQGRRNGFNIYIQVQDEPSDDDLCIGFIPDGRVARLIVQTFNEAPWMLERLHGITAEGYLWSGK